MLDGGSEGSDFLEGMFNANIAAVREQTNF